MRPLVRPICLLLGAAALLAVASGALARDPEAQVAGLRLKVQHRLPTPAPVRAMLPSPSFSQATSPQSEIALARPIEAHVADGPPQTTQARTLLPAVPQPLTGLWFSKASLVRVACAGVCAAVAVAAWRCRLQSAVPSFSTAARPMDPIEAVPILPPRTRPFDCMLHPEGAGRAGTALRALPRDTADTDPAHLKRQLFTAISEIDRGNPTDAKTTTEILALVQQLEALTPAPNDLVTSCPERLAGGWQMLWTAQPEAAEPESKVDGGVLSMLAARGSIGIIENQAYANNPAREVNPFFPEDVG